MFSILCFYIISFVTFNSIKYNNNYVAQHNLQLRMLGKDTIECKHNSDCIEPEICCNGFFTNYCCYIGGKIQRRIRLFSNKSITIQNISRSTFPPIPKPAFQIIPRPKFPALPTPVFPNVPPSNFISVPKLFIQKPHSKFLPISDHMFVQKIRRSKFTPIPGHMFIQKIPRPKFPKISRPKFNLSFALFGQMLNRSRSSGGSNDNI